jgi:Matrixin
MLLVCAATVPADAYLKFGVPIGGRMVAIQWKQQPVRYFLTDRGAPGVSATQLQAAVSQAFQTWQDVPTSTAAFQFVGFTTAEPFDEDGIVTVGFQDRPEYDRILGSTGFVVDVLTGEIVEADIMLNSAFPWSVSGVGESGHFDVQSIALHEIGHLSGLGHSLLGETEVSTSGRRVVAAEAAMFPIALSAGVVAGRTLRADDVAGISDLYPDADFARRTGSVEGRVTKNGLGVFGAHLVAFNARTGALIGGFTLTDAGDFVIAGLEPGPHVLRVEPLDDAPVDSFFDDRTFVETMFGVTYLDRIVVVPAGGRAGPVEIHVRP